MARFKVGVQFHPQHCSVDELREAWREADRLGVDSIWLWDHFFPLYGDPDGRHYEAWTLIAAAAVETSHAQLGHLVSCIGYRNPDLYADMARTIDHISHGRFILGLGAGWFQRDYDEYGYEFGEARDRVAALKAALPRIQARLARLNPGPVGPLPLMIAGSGAQVMLRLVAQYADMYHTFGNPAEYARKCAIVDDWCARLGRDPKRIERTFSVPPEDFDTIDRYLEAGGGHLILGIRKQDDSTPFDLSPVEVLLKLARS